MYDSHLEYRGQLIERPLGQHVDGGRHEIRRHTAKVHVIDFLYREYRDDAHLARSPATQASYRASAAFLVKCVRCSASDTCCLRNIRCKDAFHACTCPDGRRRGGTSGPAVYGEQLEAAGAGVAEKLQKCLLPAQIKAVNGTLII